MKQLRTLLFFVLMVCCLASSMLPWDQARGEPNEDEHAHLLLVSYPQRGLAEDEIAAYVKETQDVTFLDSPGKLSNNPLAPCALLAAGYIATDLNWYWTQITGGSSRVPPPGTQLFGMFDKDIQQGRIPRDDPAKGGEIIARLLVWYSWGTDARVNTLIYGLTQKQCLKLLLSNPDTMKSTMREVIQRESSSRVFSHTPAVARYSAILPREESETFLTDFRRSNFMSLSSKTVVNPFAPCSILRAMRRARDLSELWGQVLTESIRIVDHPMLSRYTNVSEKGAIPRDREQEAAEIAAQLFANQILRSEETSTALVSGATQGECFNEILQPGLLRKGLLNERKPSPTSRRPSPVA